MFGKILAKHKYLEEKHNIYNHQLLQIKNQKWKFYNHQNFLNIYTHTHTKFTNVGEHDVQIFQLKSYYQ